MAQWNRLWGVLLCIATKHQLVIQLSINSLHVNHNHFQKSPVGGESHQITEGFGQSGQEILYH